MSASQSYFLTPEQERLWIEWKLYPVSAVYNNHLIFKLTGLVDAQKLVSSIQQAASDDIFHLVFDEKEGKAYQKKLAFSEIKVAYIELPTLEASYHYINDLIKTSFDLKQSFPYRFFLIKQLSEDAYYLGFVMHHILMDGRSTHLFLQKIIYYYNQGTAYSSNSLDFSDYLMELPTWLDKKRYEDECYWQNKLTKGLPSIDRLRDISAKTMSARHHLMVSSEMKKTLKTLAIQQKSTLFLLLMAACQVLIYRYFDCDQLTFFYPVDIRPRHYKNVMGFFVNTLPMVTERSQQTTFLALLQDMTEQRRKDKKHQTISLLTLFNSLRTAGESINSQDYIIFSQVRFFKKPLALDGIITEEITRDFYYEAMTPLSFFYDDETEEIHFSIEYHQDLFEQWFIAQMAAHFISLLESIIKNPHQLISSLDFMERPPEKRADDLTYSLSNSCIFIQQAIEKHAQQTPNKIAIRAGSDAITYVELNTKANQFAHYLLKQGVKIGDAIGVLVHQSINTLIALIAVLKVGATYVPVDAKYPKQRQEMILTDSDSKYFLIADDLEPVTPITYSIPTIYWQQLEAMLEKESSSNLVLPIALDNAMYVIYTSGTTGIPKGIPITYRNLSSLLTATKSLFDFNKDDVWTLFHSLAFDFSVWEWCGALCYGGTLVIVPYAISRSPEQFYQLIADEKVTVLNQTPSAFYELIEMDQQKSLSLSLRVIIFGGEKLEYRRLYDWFKKYDEHCPKLINMYGITEGTIHVTFHRVSQNDLNRQESIIGQSLPHMKAYVLDQYQQLMPFGCMGELYIAGLGLTSGYINRPSETAKRFILNPYSNDPDFKWLYKTGDQVKMLPNGDLIYLDRIDTQVNVRGFRIELAEIEYQLDRLPGIKRSVVTVKNETAALSQLVAYLILEPHTHPTPSELRKSLLKRLPAYMVPTQFFQIDAIPLTINGKVDYAALTQLEYCPLHQVTSWQPDEPILARIFEIWKRYLNLDEVDIHKNFFDVGGDSLLLVQIHAELEQAFNHTFSPAILFSYPTIASLAEYFSEIASPQKASQQTQSAESRAKLRLEALKQRQHEKSML